MKEKLRIVILVLFGAIVGLLCAEVVIRTWFPSRANVMKVYEYDEDERGKFARYDMILGWDGRENADDDFEWVDCRHHVRQNKFGYRGAEYDLETKQGRRFVVLGDSFVWGFGVGNDEIFTRIMEQRAAGALEMVNMGVSGYGTDQEYLLWSTKGRRWNPGEVILTVFMPTDLWENTFASRFDYPKPVFRPTASGDFVLSNVPVPERKGDWSDPNQKIKMGGNRLVHFLLKHSAVADVTLNAASRNDALRTYLESRKIILARAAGYDHEVPLYYVRLDAQTLSAWQVFFAIVDKLNADVKKSGARLTLVLVPSVIQVYPELWEKFVLKADPDIRPNLYSDAPSQRVASWCEAKAVRFIDLLPGLREAGRTNPDLYYRENMHWTAAGHSVAATILLKELSLRD